MSVIIKIVVEMKYSGRFLWELRRYTSNHHYALATGLESLSLSNTTCILSWGCFCGCHMAGMGIIITYHAMQCFLWFSLNRLVFGFKCKVIILKDILLFKYSIDGHHSTLKMSIPSLPALCAAMLVLYGARAAIPEHPQSLTPLDWTHSIGRSSFNVVRTSNLAFRDAI